MIGTITSIFKNYPSVYLYVKLLQMWQLKNQTGEESDSRFRITIGDATFQIQNDSWLSAE